MARIGEDLAKIRKIQGKSLEDVHKSSRIPVSVLATIEDGSIFSSLSSNKTMIRSNVRSFARVLKLNDDDVIAALDRLEKGDDTHFLKEEIESDEVENEIDWATVKASKESLPDSELTPQDESDVQAELDTEDEIEPQTKTELKNTDTETETEAEAEANVIPVISTEVTNSVSNSEISNVDWEQLNRKTKMKRPPVNINWLSVFGAVIILTLGSLYFVGYFDFLFDASVPSEIVRNQANTTDNEVASNPIVGSENWLEGDSDNAENADNTTDATPIEEATTPPTDAINTELQEATDTESEVPTTANSTPENTIENEDQAEPTLASTEGITDETTPDEQKSENTELYRFIAENETKLPAELEILVYAANDNLAPVRLQWDGLSTLRPYWVEVGQAMRVGFSDELRIRTLDYDRMILVFNGHAITNLSEQFYDEEAGLLVVPRSFFESDPASWIRLKNPNEDFGGLARPSKIIDRPTFN